MQRSEKSILSRRTVVTGLAATGMLAAYVATRGSSEPDIVIRASGPGRALAVAEIDQWARLVGTSFQAAGFTLAVAGVRPLTSIGARPPEVSRDRAFLVAFEVRGSQPMPGDMIYTLSRAGQGALDVFLTSAATPEFPHRMHAVFN